MTKMLLKNCQRSRWCTRVCMHMKCESMETYVEDLKTGDIQYTNEVLPLLLGIQGLVTFFHQPLEQPVEHRLRHGTHGVGYLILVTTLGDELVTDLDPWLQQVLVKIGTVGAKQLRHALTFLKRKVHVITFVTKSTAAFYEKRVLCNLKFIMKKIYFKTYIEM